MFHILVQACLTEKQFKFGFNRKTIVFVLCLTLYGPVHMVLNMAGQ